MLEINFLYPIVLWDLGTGAGGTSKKNSETTALFASPGLSGITVDKSVEFSYEELALATNDFSNANKIGQGGFGSVYLAELRGEVRFFLSSCSMLFFHI